MKTCPDKISRTDTVTLVAFQNTSQCVDSFKRRVFSDYSPLHTASTCGEIPGLAGLPHLVRLTQALKGEQFSEWSIAGSSYLFMSAFQD